MLNNLEEQAWIARCKLLGDEKAFAKLVDRYKNRVERFFLMQTGGRQDLSDDLAQETFIRVWQSIGSLKQFATFSTWIYRIAYNIWIDHTRTVHANIGKVGNTALCDSPDPYDASHVAEHADLHEILMKALDSLVETERTCMVLYYLNELSIKEISAVTHFHESTIRCYLHRGREKMKRFKCLRDIIEK